VAKLGLLNIVLLQGSILGMTLELEEHMTDAKK
jgi:hypothetical protein